MSIVSSASTREQAEQIVANYVAEGIPAGNVKLTGWQTTTGSYDTPKEEQYPVTILEWRYEYAIGCCLYETEQNGYHDSDFYMVWWHPTTGHPMSTCFATTRFGCTVQFSSRADATEETLAAYEAWKKARDARLRQEAAEREAKEPRKDKRVRVIRGRKVKPGTEGIVFWRGRGEMEHRVGIRTDAGEKVFVERDYLEVIAP
jgi:hypothetical protein